MSKKKVNRSEKHLKYIKLLNAKRWYGEVRVAQLRQHPLCQMCLKEGIYRSAVDVHHIRPVESVPIDEMERTCYDPNNLISLCVECHIQIHRDMKSHRGQMLDIIPRQDISGNEEQLKLKAFVERCGATYRPPIKKGIRKTRFGWVTKDEYKQKQQEELEAWKERFKPKDNGLKNIEGTASVDT